MSNLDRIDSGAAMAPSLGSMKAPRPLLTTVTCGADEPAKVVATARACVGARPIKQKLTGEPLDAELVAAVREALPDIWFAVDGNQGKTRGSLERLLPTLVQARVALLEQPLAIDQDAMLDDFESPIPLAADESVQCHADLARLVVFGQLRTVADRDGPVFLTADRPLCVQYPQGLITGPEALWG